ncbi:MAG: hypothetical protein ACYSWP_11430 [Planctomycetota bacterium]|jgi:hypothetical protein
MERLKEYLEKIPSGEIADTNELEKLLAECWDDLETDYGGMAGYKLRGRMEDVYWDPPIISFRMERHGATVLGSTKAELQDWIVDIEEQTATYEMAGYRQVYERQSPLDVKPMAYEIAQLILNGENDDRLKWYDDGHVRVNIGKILPDDFLTVKQTLAGRRKRFRSALTELLFAQGWKELRPNNYAAMEKDVQKI